MADTRVDVELRGRDRVSDDLDKVEGRLRSFGEGATRAFGAAKAAALAVVAATAGIGIRFKGVLDTLDELGKLSRRVGITTETLSALKLQGDLAGVEFDQLGRALERVSGLIDEAQRGNEEYRKTFQRLGVDVDAYVGATDTLEQVLPRIADALDAMGTATERAGVAQELFGQRVGLKLAQTLEGGRESIAKYREEAEKLGVLFSSEQTRNAEEFNDSLTRLGASFDGLLAHLVPLLDGLTQYVNLLSQGIAIAGKLGASGFADALFGGRGDGTRGGLPHGIPSNIDDIASRLVSPGFVSIPNGAGAFAGSNLSLPPDQLAANQATAVARAMGIASSIARSAEGVAGLANARAIAAETQRAEDDALEYLVEFQDLLEEFWASIPEGADEAFSAARTASEIFFDDLEFRFTSTFSDLFNGITSIGDAFRQLFADIIGGLANLAASSVSSGLRSLLETGFGAVTSAVGGAATGSVATPASVAPGGFGYGSQTIIQINATDPESFQAQLAKNPEGLVSIVTAAVATKPSLRQALRAAL